MNDVTVEIVLKGLIALVPLYSQAGDTHANRMAALVVDARTIPSEVQEIASDPLASPEDREVAQGLQFCLKPHHATITFPTSDAQCIAGGCRQDNEQCECDLEDHRVNLESPGRPPGWRIPNDPPRPLPYNNQEYSAGSFSYVASLGYLGHKLSPEVFGASPPTALLASILFPVDSVLACGLGTRRDEVSDLVYRHDFREPGSPPGMGDWSQAVAQKVVSRVTLESDGNSYPVLRMKKFDGSWSYDFDLKGRAVRIKIENHREPIKVSGHPCDDGVGRDYGFFYDLAESPPSWLNRKLPHTKFTSWKSIADLNPPQCEKKLVVASRPICPLASFPPVVEPLEVHP